MELRNAKEIRKRKRLENEMKNYLLEGKSSKKFKSESIDVFTEIEKFSEDLANEEEVMPRENNLEPLNLRNEKEAGQVERLGNHVLITNNSEVTDPWLDSISSLADVKKEESEEPEKHYDVNYNKKRISELLENEETVAEALKRLRGPIGTKKPFKKNVRKSQQVSQPSEFFTSKKEFEELCKLCSEMVWEGFQDVYTLKKSDLINAKMT